MRFTIINGKIKLKTICLYMKYILIVTTVELNGNSNITGN